MRTTLRHIADDTGMSISTVSRVLRGKGKISPLSQKRILESAEKLNYPFIDAQQPLEVRNDIHFAIVAQTHPGEYYSAFFHGFVQAVRGTGVSFSLFSINEREDNLITLLEQIKRKRYDGVVVMLAALNSEDYGAIKKVEEPDFVILSNAIVQRALIDTIAFDGYSGGYMTVDHFVSKGYYDLGLIKGDMIKSDARFRANGFVDSINSHEGAKLAWSFDGDFSARSGLEAFRSFHEAKHKPRAIFSSNDVMAFAFMREALKHGYKIPEDVAIVGYDDLKSCEYFYPSLSSIHTDYKRLGEVVVHRLLDRLEGKASGNGALTYLVPVHLAARESS